MERKIGEQFVSFDTAKLLKEAGFDVPTSTHYSNSGEVWQSSAPEDYNDDKSCKACSRPTQALAARWLREVHGIHVSSNIFMDSANDADGKTVDEWTFWSFDLFDNSGRIIEERDDRYDSYEEALEVGLREAIKLIKK